MKMVGYFLALLATVVVVGVECEVVERDYDILPTDARLIVVDEEYFTDDSYLSVSMFNETTPIIESTMYVVKTLPQELMIQVIGFRKYGTKFLQSFDLGQNNYCEYLKINKMFVQNLLRAGKAYNNCPLPAGDHVISDLTIDPSPFPANLQESDWKVDVLFTDGDRLIWSMEIFTTIVRKNNAETPSWGKY